MTEVRFLPAGDTAVTVEFGNEISEAVNARVRAFRAALERGGVPGIVETVPTYRSLTVHYDPGVILYAPLVELLRKAAEDPDRAAPPPGDVVELPVLYGGEAGPDLDFVAEHSGKTPQEVIRLHASAEYLIYMLGFTPGFPYLGGMDGSIAAPRLETPRVQIPAGSVGIAGKQTGVYPVPSPGGWRLIGRTPVRLYAPERTMPILLRAGEYLRFCPIDRAEYDRIAALEAAGGYVCRRYPKEAET